MNYKLKTKPSAEAISLTEAKAHLRVSVSSEDDLINDLIVAARQWTERYCRRAFLTQTWELYLDCFPDDEILLEKSPVSSVTSVKYYDEDNSLQTFANTKYIVDTAGKPGRIGLTPDESWPSTAKRINAVIVEFISGDANAATFEEQYMPIKQAMLIFIEHNYDNRGDDGRPVMPKAMEDMLNAYALWRF